MIGSKVYRRYASALLGLGREDGHFEQYGQELSEFERFCQANSMFFGTVCNPIFAMEGRHKVLEEVLGRSSFGPVVQNFLRLLLAKDRLQGLPAICEHYAHLADEALNIQRARVVTAKPLRKKSLDRLERALERLTGKKVKAEVSDDEALIGGVMVKIGDMVLDGSIRAQIEGLKESLKRGELS